MELVFLTQIIADNNSTTGDILAASCPELLLLADVQKRMEEPTSLIMRAEHEQEGATDNTSSRRRADTVPRRGRGRG